MRWSKTSSSFVTLFLSLLHYYHLLLGQKKRSCFRKSAGWKSFCHSLARLVKCVSEYMFLISKNIKQTNKQTNKQKNKKKQRKLKRKRGYSGKSIEKNKFVVARVMIFLVTRFSGNKSNFFWTHVGQAPPDM